MTRTKGRDVDRATGEDQQLNDRFNSALREAAEKREAREQRQLDEDEAAARQESADLLALARSRRSEQAAATG